VAGSLLVGTGAAAAQDDPSAEDLDLPRTMLEAEQRDDGGTDAAPWVIGSGLAALAAVGIGGAVLKRRSG
jgi:hypothetical protein